MKLNAILAEFHAFDGKWDWLRPLRVRLEFADAPPVRIELKSDGESVRINSLPLDGPLDMGEYGATFIRDATVRFAPDLSGVDVELKGIAAGETSFAGVAIVHDGRAALCFWNWGDELLRGSWDAMFLCDWDGRSGRARRRRPASFARPARRPVRPDVRRCRRSGSASWSNPASRSAGWSPR